MQDDKILDIDIKAEFEKIKKREEVLNSRFLALGMDFKFYFSVSIDEDKFFNIRNDIFYRLYGSIFHIELLLSHFNAMQHQFEKLSETAKKENWQPPFLDNIKLDTFLAFSSQRVSSIFDSIIYHLTTIFDYIGSIINYIFKLTGSKEQPLKWTGLTGNVRDTNKEIYNSSVGNAIRTVDHNFVGPLYGHRSTLIHKQGDICDINIILRNQEPSTVLEFMSTSLFCKNFHQLKEISKTQRPTLRYVLFWVINRVYDAIREILLALKADMKEKGQHPMQRTGSHKALVFGIIGDSGHFESPSEDHWQINNPL